MTVTLVLGSRSPLASSTVMMHSPTLRVSVGDDGGGRALDVAVPGRVWLGVPDDFDGLAGGELADFGLVEVGADLDSVEVGDVEQRFAGWTKS